MENFLIANSHKFMAPFYHNKVINSNIDSREEDRQKRKKNQKFVTSGMLTNLMFGIILVTARKK
jgi:hypothetical protein